MNHEAERGQEVELADNPQGPSLVTHHFSGASFPKDSINVQTVPLARGQVFRDLWRQFTLRVQQMEGYSHL